MSIVKGRSAKHGSRICSRLFGRSYPFGLMELVEGHARGRSEIMWGEVKIIFAATVTFGFMAVHEMNNDYQTMTLVMAILLAGWIASGKE